MFFDWAAADENTYVRWRVAVNPSTPPELLGRVAADEATDMR